MKGTEKKPAPSDACSILPTLEQVLLLRACLQSGQSGREAWEAWQSQRSNFHNGLETTEALSGLRPLLLNALRRNAVAADKTFLTYLRVAHLREEARTNIYRRICGRLLSTLRAEGIQAILLKGAALADTVYPSPVLRHCHDIDILLMDGDLQRAVRALSSQDFMPFDETPEPVIDDMKLVHRSGLPLELHSRLFRTPFYNETLAGIWTRSQEQMIADVPSRILSPADNLLHVCVDAFYCESRQSLRWVCDSWLIIDRYPNLDWNMLLDNARDGDFAQPLSIILGYLEQELNAAIPAAFLDRLYAAAP
ncbi:MAG: nucleotidyltransferase family protein [Deltaproteobacteria bacterium]|nr:MAG: nucleotidyltransferase family protein [Deltaproteobacteria bacterium]